MHVYMYTNIHNAGAYMHVRAQAHACKKEGFFACGSMAAYTTHAFINGVHYIQYFL